MSDTLGLVHLHGIQNSENPFHGQAGLAARRFGSQTLIEWVVRRVTEAESLSDVAVLLGPQIASQIAPLVPPDVNVFLCQTSDGVDQIVEAAEHYQLPAVLLVGVECPFVDPALIDRLVFAAGSNDCDYVGGCHANGEAAILSEVGMLAEWCTVSALATASRALGQSSSSLHDVTQHILNHSQQFRIQRVPMPSSMDRHDLRLGIQSSEDWEHAHVIYDALSAEELDWRGITGLLDQQPELRERMARLNAASKSIPEPHLHVTARS